MILLQRVCWNTHNWRGPSGRKFGLEDSYAGKHGFGHEEWNFNTAQLVDDSVCGYMYYHPPKNSPAWQETHDVYFFSIAPDKRRLLVGAYLGVHFLDRGQSRQILEAAKSSGLLETRAEELMTLDIQGLTRDSALRLLEQDFAMNLSVRPDRVVVFDPPRELMREDVAGRDPRHLNRYAMALPLTRRPEGSRPSPPPPEAKGTTDLLDTDAYVRYTKAQQRVVERRHNSLSNAFRAWLRQIGARDVTGEAGRVDVTCTAGDKRCLFELKCVFQQSTRHALREALGQVLDYSYYPGRSLVNYRAIVLDQRPSDDDLRWLRSLNRIGVDVEILWLRGAQFEVESLGREATLLSIIGEALTPG